MSDRQTTFALALALVLVAGTFLTYFAFQNQYVEARPVEDCSQPYDYPMCRRAAEPAPRQEPGPAEVYLGLLLTGVLSLILIVVSLKSTVMSQREIVAPGGAQRDAAQLAPVVERTPPAIPNNAIPPELVAPPQAKPKQGPDLKQLEARNG